VEAERACRAKCKWDYDINTSFCHGEPRNQRSICRAEEGLTRAQCAAAC
jgi:hypothetical protein